MKTFLTDIWKRILDLRRDSQGFVVMSTLAIFLFLFVLCAFVYAVGETIHQRIKMQNACDAAAYSAAVVQADGLSRMATVNRAMAWSYVQMTNRQMDYITYRWLKLTCKRFQEDLDNGAKFNHLSIFAVDKELGWWALLEVAATAVISELAKLECTGYKDGDKLPSRVGHRDEGHGYWCGLELGDRKEHNLRLNVNKEDLGNFWDEAKNSVLDGIANMVFTKDNIEKILSVFKFIDSEEGWGGRLGTLIDYDKSNIKRMNNALGRINKQMTLSMKMTAEGIVKSMLKDRRMDSKEVLKDYFISIHIPEGKDPYETDSTQKSVAPDSFFSPLRNTEVDEMLFLNMVSSEKAGYSLKGHFPLLLAENGAFGLDKWFIRGKANYSDNKDHGYDGSPLNGVSFAPQGETSVTTQRDEGSLGIQRVYKDTNLNDTKAGFFSRDKEKVTKTEHHEARTVQFTQRRALPECCQKNWDGVIDFEGSVFRPSSWTVDIAAHDYTYQEEVIKEKRHGAIWRGNHLIDLTNVTQIITDGIQGFIGANGGESDEEEDEEDDGSTPIESEEELEEAKRKAADTKEEYTRKKNEAVSRKSRLQTERATATPERQREIDAEIARLDDEIKYCDDMIDGADSGIGEMGKFSPGGGQMSQNSNNSGQSQGIMGEAISTLMDGLNSAMGNLIGQYLDIQPSCGNDPGLSYAHYPACRDIKNPTTALYSEYRWASCKWFCLTKGFTYAVCAIYCIFDDKTGIYCDIPKRTIVKIGGKYLNWKIKGKGLGHYGWPKWFCGYGPDSSLLDNLPPLWGEITGPKHGYMGDIWDFGSNGFLRPIRPLRSEIMSDRVFSRRDYESCAMFPDGLDLDPRYGHKAWPGLVRGHARIYADDKEIFDNRYVGARCKPWVLNERFFAGDGTILVGAAMKHVNPFVQLFNLWNTTYDDDSKQYTKGSETQEQTEKTVLSAFNIPKKNFMWTMSAARAGVRHQRRGGAFDQERQYQITYDSTSDVENLDYSTEKYVLDETEESEPWISQGSWGGKHQENPQALSRIHFPAQTQVPVWNGCPCCRNTKQFKNLWNLCETDWDATLIPVRYAGQKASLYLSKGCGSPDLEDLPFNELSYTERRSLVGNHIADDNTFSKTNGETEKEKNDMVIGNGKSWRWNSPMSQMSTFITSNPFLNASWKPANARFFENLFLDSIGKASSVISMIEGLNLQNKIPTGKEEKSVDLFSIFVDKVL